MQQDVRVEEMQVHDYARQLLEAHGDKALAEAARKAQSCADKGAADQAAMWRRVEAAMKVMRGPHQG